MTTKTRELHRRMIRILRQAMSLWAAKWRFYRKDPVERATARAALQNAIAMRDMAREWEKMLL